MVLCLNLLHRILQHFLPPIDTLREAISTSISETVGEDIAANITFEDEVIDQIFGGETLTEIPLNFYSIYTTDPNNAGWRTEVSFRANGAKIDDSGNIKAYKCLDNPEADCISENLTLKNLGEFSEDYRQTVAFKLGANNRKVNIGNARGRMVVDASDVKYFFDSDGEDRLHAVQKSKFNFR